MAALLSFGLNCKKAKKILSHLHFFTVTAQVTFVTGDSDRIYIQQKLIYIYIYIYIYMVIFIFSVNSFFLWEVIIEINHFG